MDTARQSISRITISEFSYPLDEAMVKFSEQKLKAQVMRLENQVSTLQNEVSLKNREIMCKNGQIEAYKEEVQGMEVLKKTNERLLTEINSLNQQLQNMESFTCSNISNLNSSSLKNSQVLFSNFL